MVTIAERLGHPPEARLLLVECAGLGFCHAANLGVFETLAAGIGRSASLMVPAPWSREAVSRYRGEDIGVCLTLNAEHERYRWGPITHAPSLLDGDGGFPRTVADVWDHADLDEVRNECRAQIERAILWGFDVSHLDTHLDTMLLRPEFFDVYLELAVEFSLPVRLLAAEEEPNVGFPIRQLAADEGVLFADQYVSLPSRRSHQALVELLPELASGLTQITVRPACDTPELRAIVDDWDERVADHVGAADGPGLGRAIREAGVVTVGFVALREAMRHP